MKTIIKTLQGKYIINMLMIVIFAALAFSGLVRGGEGGHHSGRDFRSEQFHHRGEGIPLIEQGGAERDFYLADFNPMPGEREMDFHTLAGLIWLLLMVIHIWQHWGWFKRLFTFKHIWNNKLLSITILVFILLSFSGISLAFHLIPRGLFNVKEVHELLGQLLGILIVIHCIQRFKWIVTTSRNLFNQFRLSVSRA
jgi:hypothetical protein